MEYRMLKAGERIKKGDEHWNKDEIEWEVVTRIDPTAFIICDNVYRRPIYPEPIRLLKESIEYWEHQHNYYTKLGLEYNPLACTYDFPVHNRATCPLCRKYNRHPLALSMCSGCPIKNKTNQRGCWDTPYRIWSDTHSEKDHQAMIDWMKELYEELIEGERMKSEMMQITKDNLKYNEELEKSMGNYFMLDGEKVPMSKETAESLREKQDKFYTCGTKIIISEEKYIICTPDKNKICLINTRYGTRWGNPIFAEKRNGISGISKQRLDNHINHKWYLS